MLKNWGIVKNWGVPEANEFLYFLSIKNIIRTVAKIFGKHIINN